MYGGIVIEPAEAVQLADRDYVVVLSDWTNEGPEEVLRTLKRGSEWYTLRKRSGQSILGAARLDLPLGRFDGGNGARSADRTVGTNARGP